MRKFRNNIKKFLTLILCILIVTNFSVKSANAVVVVDDALVVGGGVALAPEIGIVLIGAGIGYAGYKVVDEYGPEVKRYVLDSLKEKGIEQFISHTSVNEKDYAILNSVGLDEIQRLLKYDFKSTGLKTKVPTSKNTSPDIKKPYAPFQFKNLICEFSPISGSKTINCGIVKSGDTFQFLNAYSFSLKNEDEVLEHYISSYTSKQDTHYKIEVEEIVYYGTPRTRAYLYSSIDNVEWKLEKACGYYTTENSWSVYGWGTVSNTVYTPADKCLDGIGIDGNASDKIGSGNAVAVPISGQYATENNVGYTSIDGDAGVIDISTGNDIDINSGVSDAWYERVVESVENVASKAKENAKDIVNSIENTASDVIDSVKSIPTTISDTAEKIFSVPEEPTELDFKPLMISCQKFPFCIPWDLWECFKIFEADPEPFSYEFEEVVLNSSITDNKDIVLIPNFNIDFRDYPKFDIGIKIFKFFELILFIVFLLRNVRSNFMKG